MKQRWHVRPDGTYGICTAQPGNCPFGSEAHFDTEDEAREYRDNKFFSEMVLRMSFNDQFKEILEIPMSGQSLVELSSIIEEDLLDNPDQMSNEDVDYIQDFLRDRVETARFMSKDEREEALMDYGLQRAIEESKESPNDTLEIHSATAYYLVDQIEQEIVSSIYYNVIDDILQGEGTKEDKLKTIVEKLDKVHDIQYNDRKKADLKQGPRSHADHPYDPSQFYRSAMWKMEEEIEWHISKNIPLTKNDIIKLEKELIKESTWTDAETDYVEGAIFDYGVERAFEAVNDLGYEEVPIDNQSVNKIANYVYEREFNELLSELIFPVIEKQGLKDDEPIDLFGIRASIQNFKGECDIR